MFLEGWGLTPDQVAPLTDDQIERCYRRPAIKRAEAMKRQADGGTEGAAPVADLDTARPDRETFVTSMMDAFGGDRAKWDADYDRLEKSWEKSR